MNTPTEHLFRLVYFTERIQLKRMLITEIKITQENPTILYQVPFELTTAPLRAWKEVFMDSWKSITQHKGRISETIIWVFHNRVLVDKVPIELVKNDLETLLKSVIDRTNFKINLRTESAI